MSKHPAWKVTRYAAHAAQKAITDLGRWANTDHTGAAKRLANLPPMGWMDTLSFVLLFGGLAYAQLSHRRCHTALAGHQEDLALHLVRTCFAGRQTGLRSQGV